MKLYFMRHTHAEDGYDDAARALTAFGREQARAMAQFCRQAGVDLDLAVASPLVRARQTAEEFLRAGGYADSVKLEVSEALLNEAADQVFEDLLDRLGGLKQVLLVGHAPVLAARVRRMVGMTPLGGLNLAKGAMACVRSEDRRSGELKFLVGPKTLGLR